MTAIKKMKKIIENTNKPFDWYTAPSTEIFEDIKANAIKLWRTYDDSYGYASEKIAWVESMKNIKDNVWTIVAMFDYENQFKLLSMVQPATAKLLGEALKEYYKDGLDY